ncbi:MAG: response regulator transcription factor [Candidatus Competibacteraceae bacterium]|nr:response regulator transcription factor [Candidatus Competibacteraceae bacterium]
MKEPTVLIVDDNDEIREGIRILLKSERYAVLEAKDGDEALSVFTEDIDLLILDIMMPGQSGLKVCEEIRKKSNVPILFLSAKSHESDKMLGLMIGADDYLPKPFSYPELLGRVRALLRRYTVYKGRREEESSGTISIGSLAVNEKRNQVTLGGKTIRLTETEYQLLLLLAGNRSRIFSTEEIYEKIWKSKYTVSSSGTVMVHIRKLRSKIEEDSRNPKYIQTVWGKGYRCD